ncbi:3-phosphoserine/phosphohydroxythreonine transaminase [Metallumcola ferriviriculae]|uniref:Phosphoserine aminotransferase n=2 Tax=Metallumcola ferriviriculae TaxID=3039180 RepID=A0AAU0UR97_9FIRM|nr:3-phosphoserine/phosphohydroxythreonine transaminase [Desulfitibacteraceae bacterium MK1]
MNKVFNFYPGPATLPQPVLETARTELLNYRDSGMSVMEMSHRSKPIENVIASAEANLKELLKIPEGYRVLFLQGGATSQFFMIPFNFLTKDQTANYVLTGSFAEKAYKEALKTGSAHTAASTKEEKFRSIPKLEDISVSDNAAYLHLTSNNTIYGTQWQQFPQLSIPVVADMSSDILSRPFDVSNFDLIYAGAQKNLGPAGVTVVIISEKLINISAQAKLPDMLKYSVHAEKDSMFNTPPTFPVYIVNLVLEWIKENGGLEKMAARNQEKADMVYQVIDQNPDFYQGHAISDRSLMNISFRLPNEDLEKEFVHSAEKVGLVGLKGHRSVGGIRASIYNAMPVEGCAALAAFMLAFRKTH